MVLLMVRIKQFLSVGLVVLAIIGCGIKVDLPTETVEFDPVFGAGDTSYIRISPDWDSSNGYAFASPWDIIVGADGYVFIADHNQASIHVISTSGEEVINDDYGNHFGALSNLIDEAGASIFPQAIHQDDRLNLFIADSSNRLMVWNQYLNNVGVDSMATSVRLESPTGELLWVVGFDSINALQEQDWTIDSIGWSDENLDYWLAPRAFWNASDSLEAIEVERYFIDPSNVHVTGVSTSGDQCFVADANSNAIMELQYVPVALLLTARGDQILVYGGTITSRAVSPGTGNGTVNDPRGMIHGNDGALFYTQWGENFSVHKVGGSSGFEYGEDDIMEIERYEMASDVSLDVLGNIYVADTGHDRIQQFNPSGRFTFNIGMNRVLVDSTYSDSILVGSEYEYITRDTTYLVEVADILDGPRSVAVDATGVVYIADTKHQRVMRYRLSTELDYTTEE
jgi:DNA-binding beta-propeller fold protein YncE